MTHQLNSSWPLLAVHCDTILLLAVSQKFRHCTSLAAASSIVQVEGNESTGLQFHLVQLFWPLEPISSIVSLSCRGKVAVGSRTISPTYKNLTSGQRVGAPVGKTRNVLGFSMYSMFMYSCQYMCNGKCSTSQNGKGAIVPNWPLDTSKNEFTFLKESLPTHIIHHEKGRMASRLNFKWGVCSNLFVFVFWP